MSGIQKQQVKIGRYSEAVILSYACQLTLGLVYGIHLEQWWIAAAFWFTGLFSAGLSLVLMGHQLTRQHKIWLNHFVFVANFLVLNLVLVWTGQNPATSVWWLVLWPIFAAHFMSVRAGCAWLLVAIVFGGLHWLNARWHWIPGQMADENNPQFLTQVFFLAVGGGYAIVVRRAYERYERFINAQNKALEEKAAHLSETLIELEKTQLSRTRLFAQLTHEIRTPTNGLLGFMQLLQRSTLDKQQASYVDNACHCGEVLLHAINEILDFSKLESHSPTVDRVAFDPYEVVEDVVEMMRPLAEGKGLHIDTGESVQEPHSGFLGDPVRIKQIILNFVSNAIKATNSGVVHVSFRWGPNQDLLFEVHDTGMGIKSEHLDSIFEPFGAASDEFTQSHGGTGLGLSISKRLAQLMGGSVGVSSKTGQGSTFWLRLPFEFTASA